ncbi:MAG: MFS transporter [Pseudomonadota bacterium]
MEKSVQTASEEPPASRGSYAFLALLSLLNVMNFVDRQLLSSFANYIVPELGLSNTQFGLLTGLVFLVFYSVMGLFMGYLADTLNRTRLIAFGLALWSGLTALSGAARGFWSLAAPRMFIGIGESIMTPTAMSLLADRFPARQLGFASGVYYMGVPIGVGVSLLIVGYLGPAIGWRNCFYLLGVIGLLFAVVMLFIRETPRRHLTAAAATDASAPRQSFSAILKTLLQALRQSPALCFTIAGGVALHFILGAAAFDQLWFAEERGFDRDVIARSTGWIAMIAGILGNLVGGLGSDWFLRRTGQGRPMFLFWIMLLLAPINVIYRLVPAESLWFWVGVFVGYFQLGCFYGPTFSTVQELVPPQIRATVVAFYILLLNLMGMGIGITAGGMVADALIAAGHPEPYSATLLGFTLLSLLAVPLFYLAGRRFFRDRERLYAVAT